MRRGAFLSLILVLAAEATPAVAARFRPEIAFVRHRSDATYAPQVRGLDGAGSQRILKDGAAGVAWHPDGRRLAVDLRDALVSMRLDGTVLRKLAVAGPDDDLGGGAWSPDGTRFAYQRYDVYTGDSQIEILDLATRDARVLVANDAFNVRPVWTPDGRSIVFSRDTGGPTQMDVYVVDAEGGSPAQLTSDLSDDVAAAVSPSGDRILISSDRAGSTDLYLIPVTGESPGSAEQLTNWPGFEAGGDFSPDGSRIVFWADVEGNSDLYALDLASREVDRLTSGPAMQVSPTWRPARV